MSTNIFGHNCLNDNWFEDRLQPGSARSDKGNTTRAYEADLAYIGERYDVLSRISRIPQRQSYATPDDGFNEKLRTSSVDFCHPKSRPEFARGRETTPSLINTENAPVCPPEQRTLPGTISGFGAALHRHGETHDKRFWNTAHCDYFGDVSSRRATPRINPGDSNAAAGCSTEHEEQRVQGLRVGKLCGEFFNDSDDPALHSPTQRSWLYNQDAAIRNIHLGGKKRTLLKDEDGMSLPLGDGAMCKIRDDLKERQGRLFRVATTITKGHGSRPGASVFQDHTTYPPLQA